MLGEKRLLKIYSSKTLKLEIHQYHTVNYFFSKYLGNEKENLVPNPNYCDLIFIVNSKDNYLPFDEFKKYIKKCTQNSNVRIANSAKHLMKRYKGMWKND